MSLTHGAPEVVVGLLDGPVAADHPILTRHSIHQSASLGSERCGEIPGAACCHGTFIAGILAARRDRGAPGICPECTLLILPVFREAAHTGGQLPSVTPELLAEAIGACVDTGVHVVNLSVGMPQPFSPRADRVLADALDDAARQGVLVVAAAGNQGTLGSSAITRHPWVIPVVGYGADARPSAFSNLGSSMGKRGLGAPSEGVTSLSTEGGFSTRSGTSFAAPFVTGAIALLWSQFPRATAAEVKDAVMGARVRRTSITPPLLNAWAAYRTLATARSERARR
ncbi:S8 family serine peptidase [Streptomyces sp. NPDC058734]|uniref:S8 family peptidase n=1 Tax=Streptomyces sp. NPDC058734 TaxID=3346615 RepID=UPI0036B0EB11